ncbi:MAG: DUF4258 domain-containing protein [Lachnospiraceae bacterium]|jgi:hypothetical protein|nr:DUF4258 domain-containing protein [Lachnospiraceae bacterium]
MNLQLLREFFAQNRSVEYTKHCLTRMMERDITRADIRKVIMQGEIIEDYPLDENNTSEKSFPSCLIMGYRDCDNRVIHVVVGFNGSRIIVISAYYPDSEHWLYDYKTRR